MNLDFVILEQGMLKSWLVINVNAVICYIFTYLPITKKTIKFFITKINKAMLNSVHDISDYRYDDVGLISFVSKLTLKVLRGTIFGSERIRAGENKKDKRFITRAILTPVDILLVLFPQDWKHYVIYIYILRSQEEKINNMKINNTIK